MDERTNEWKKLYRTYKPASVELNGTRLAGTKLMKQLKQRIGVKHKL